MLLRNSNRSSRAGGVLVATLVLVSTVAALSACLFQLNSTRARRQLASTDNKRAFNIAEAGIAEAFYGLSIGKTGNVGAIEEPARFGDGLFWVKATDMGGNIVGLESTGMCGSGRATLSLVVRCKSTSIASLGVLGANEVTVGANARIESYDSRAPAAAPGAVRVQSNGAITMSENATIVGDAAPGPLSSVTLGRGATVTGSTAPSAEKVELPLITVPSIESQGNIAGRPLFPRIIQGEMLAYDTLTVGAATQVDIRGPATLVVKNLNVASLGTLRFLTNAGPITLYVTDSIKLASGSNIAFSSSDPTQVSMLVTANKVMDRDGDGSPDQPVRISCAGPFYTTLYAPEARVSLPAAFQLFGTVAAGQLTLGATAKVHFDTALQENDSESSVSVERLSWRVVEIPVEIARSLDPDPFAALAVDPAALLKPVDAHADPGFQIDIQYTDAGGTPQTYRGPEAAFNWSLVKTVDTIVRKVL